MYYVCIYIFKQNKIEIRSFEKSKTIGEYYSLLLNTVD